MSRSTLLETDWADGTYRFRLRIGELEELQGVTDAGPLALYNRLYGGTWLPRDLGATIRLGLMGGGMSAAEALKKVRYYVDDRPLMENVPVAMGILAAVLFGVEDEPLGEAPAANPEGSDSMGSPTTS